MPDAMPDSTARATPVSRRHTSARKPRGRTPRAPDAIALLRADHRTVSALFDEFENARSPSRKKELVAEICSALSVHTTIEEEIFYPAVQSAMKDHELVPEARVEHASVRTLIAQVEGAEPGGDDYDATVKVMAEYVKHHVKEEQTEMFPKAKASGVDLVALGERLARRKEELATSAS
jgi:hemerythrin-like domain-containing protein